MQRGVERWVVCDEAIPGVTTTPTPTSSSHKQRVSSVRTATATGGSAPARPGESSGVEDEERADDTQVVEVHAQDDANEACNKHNGNEHHLIEFGGGWWEKGMQWRREW